MELLRFDGAEVAWINKKAQKEPCRESGCTQTWEIISINVCLDDLRCFQANALGIAGAQMMILMALTDLDSDDGVPVNVVAKLMKVDSSFITIHSKRLEEKRFVRRKPCTKGCPSCTPVANR